MGFMYSIEDFFNGETPGEIIKTLGYEHLEKVDWRRLVQSFGAGLLGESYAPTDAEEKYVLIIGRWINDRLNKARKDRESYQEQAKHIDNTRSAHTLRALRTMDPKDFEYWSARYFKDKGYRNIWVVPPGPDFGLDIQMTCPNGIKAIVQCKRYSVKHFVDRPVVQQTYGVMRLLKARKCFIVTTSSFTRDALELGQRKDIVLIDGSTLATEAKVRRKPRISTGNNWVPSRLTNPTRKRK
jgi:hypothetical protein